MASLVMFDAAPTDRPGGAVVSTVSETMSGTSTEMGLPSSDVTGYSALEQKHLTTAELFGGKLELLEGRAVHKDECLALGIEILHDTATVFYFLDRLDIGQRAVDRPSIAYVAQLDMHRRLLLAGVALVEVRDFIDMTLMPDPHAAIEWDIRHDRPRHASRK